MDFSKCLRKTRIERNLTQQALADAIKVELRTYQRYEQGTREPSFAVLIALSDILQVSTDYLLGKDEEHIETID